VIIFYSIFFSIFVPFVEVLLQTYIRVLQIKNEENEQRQEKKNFARISLGRNVNETVNHVQMIQSQQALGPWQDGEVPG
jgi:hypothetical protein